LGLRLLEKAKKPLKDGPWEQIARNGLITGVMNLHRRKLQGCAMQYKNRLFGAGWGGINTKYGAKEKERRGIV